METYFSLTISDIISADVSFMKQSINDKKDTNNLWYLVWMNKEKNEIIVAKSRTTLELPSIQYVNIYKSIEEYYEADIMVGKEHLIFFYEGLFEKVFKFFEKYGSKHLIEKLRQQKEEVEFLGDANDHIIDLQNSVPLQSNPNEIIPVERMIDTIEEIIVEHQNSGKDLAYTDREIQQLQDKIELKEPLTYNDLDIFAKFFIKSFGFSHEIAKTELEDIIKRMVPKYFFDI